MLDTLSAYAPSGMRYVPTLALLWLAFLFGRTLRAGATPLIERIAREGKPELSAALCRYTQRLTLLWCAYFVIAALLTVMVTFALRQSSTGVAAVSALLFVGEYRVRQRLFPNELFPGLLQQARDTVVVWRPRRAS